MSKMTDSEINDAVDNTVNYLGKFLLKLIKVAAVLFIIYMIIVFGGFYIWMGIT